MYREYQKTTSEMYHNNDNKYNNNDKDNDTNAKNNNNDNNNKNNNNNNNDDNDNENDNNDNNDNNNNNNNNNRGFPTWLRIARGYHRGFLTCMVAQSTRLPPRLSYMGSDACAGVHVLPNKPSLLTLAWTCRCAQTNGRVQTHKVWKRYAVYCRQHKQMEESKLIRFGCTHAHHTNVYIRVYVLK